MIRKRDFKVNLFPLRVMEIRLDERNSNNRPGPVGATYPIPANDEKERDKRYPFHYI